MNKKHLSILLSQLQPFARHKAALEQYETECNIAADAAWTAYMDGNITHKTIADLGCGPGILGIAALLLGATHVTFLDVDKNALAIAEQNVHAIEQATRTTFMYRFVHGDVTTFTTPVDTVLMNPPFGVQHEHADRPFLTTAMTIAPVIYSFHKRDTQPFIDRYARDHAFTPTLLKTIGFPLPRTQHYHAKEKYSTLVGLWKFTSK